MQINNNYQPSFGKVLCHKQLQKALDNGVFSDNVKQEIEKFKNKFDKSQVTVLFGLTEGLSKRKPRLDAQVFYEDTKSDKSLCEYISENPFPRMFGLSPKGFFRKVQMELEYIAETFCIK